LQDLKGILPETEGEGCRHVAKETQGKRSAEDVAHVGRRTIGEHHLLSP